MNVKLKRLSEQVMVITGASSGIGLVTARMAAKRGTRLILNARNEKALQRVCQEIRLRASRSSSA
jgi:short-subunit dehydrogenase